jgi:hypothetical protein
MRPDVIRILGGLPGGAVSATAGAHSWQRQPHEPERDFIARAQAEAAALALPYVIVGGLA